MKVNDIITEGPLDYLKGVGGYAARSAYDKLAASGQRVMAPIIKAHQIGKASSLEGDIDKTIKQLIQLVKPTPIQVSPPVNATPTARTRAKRTPINPVRTDPTFEGFMDYLKGAGGAVKGAVQTVHAAGQERSKVADTERKEQLKQQLAAKLASLAQRLGSNGQKVILKKIIDNGIGQLTPLYKQLKIMIFGQPQASV